jgi:hypothetical protein
MKFSEYVKSLTDLLEENPDLSDMEVYCADDEEGNGFSPVVYTPTQGHYDRGAYCSLENMLADDHNTVDVINAVCIN